MTEIVPTGKHDDDDDLIPGLIFEKFERTSILHVEKRAFSHAFDFGSGCEFDSMSRRSPLGAHRTPSLRVIQKVATVPNHYPGSSKGAAGFHDGGDASAAIFESRRSAISAGRWAQPGMPKNGNEHGFAFDWENMPTRGVAASLAASCQGSSVVRYHNEQEAERRI